jgi:hypothetical protein
MHAVGIRLKPSDLSEQMAAMRTWLDEHRIDVSTFACRDNGEGMTVQIEFRLAHQATAFAERFGGRASLPSVAYAKDLVRRSSPTDELVG